MKANRFVSSGIARSQNNSTLCSSYIINVIYVLHVCYYCCILINNYNRLDHLLTDKKVFKIQID